MIGYRGSHYILLHSCIILLRVIIIKCIVSTQSYWEHKFRHCNTGDILHAGNWMPVYSSTKFFTHLVQEFPVTDGWGIQWRLIDNFSTTILYLTTRVYTLFDNVYSARLASLDVITCTVGWLTLLFPIWLKAIKFTATWTIFEGRLKQQCTLYDVV